MQIDLPGLDFGMMDLERSLRALFSMPPLGLIIYCMSKKLK
jgi:hypothetical protein